jgi:hypothetical protein
MAVVHIIWDLDDDPDGNVQHIAEHDLTKAEVREVLLAPASRGVSQSSGAPTVFGWTSTGRYIMVVYEQVEADVVYPVTAYNVPTPAPKKGKRRKR